MHHSEPDIKSGGSVTSVGVRKLGAAPKSPIPGLGAAPRLQVRGSKVVHGQPHEPAAAVPWPYYTAHRPESRKPKCR